MTLDNAIKRLILRFTPNGKDQLGNLTFKAFYPKLEDLEALNEIIDYCNNQKKTEPKKHTLFAKLYVWVYKELLNHYNTTVFDKEPIKEISKILDTPLKNHYIEFWRSLNRNEKYLRFKDNIEKNVSNELLNKNPLLRTEIERNGLKDALKRNYDHLSEEQRVLVFEKEPFEWESTRDNLNTIITQSLNKFS